MIMLQAKDLMVGDFVINTDFERNVIDTIDTIEQTRVWLTNGRTYVPIEFISPIPITPKILEKNGFVLKEEEKGAYGVDIAPYYTRDDVPFEVFCDGEPFAIWFKDPINIKYVHQLQHALHLCGIEKEIVL